ncbi:MAG: bifunctional phosphoribosylaminoimidazolecarboxamide formyltransferase/IMP cyclohydrolase [Candidatus Peregrinibacteria bacterium]|nr:bifunctional phosphoribosylaminoimidazolecarboxamide formyltransferase/IMP cyclohydrolase [Candidatus Peregrinibacteria bacterium]
MKTALISVSEKRGVVEFAQGLERLNFRILSTGGTFRELQNAGVKNLLEVSDFTGFPEGLDGRIKTLTPQIFGGILNLRNHDGHQAFCKENEIENIDLVVVNLYPFKSTYENPDKSFEDKVENIDIGGPSMIRAAAKNYEFCAPVVDPADYSKIISELENGDISLETRKDLATKVFEMTAHYDLLIAKFWAEETKTTEVKGALRYGENPHQKAVTITDPFASGPLLVGANVLNGKPLSYNNFGDSAGALELALSFAGENDPAFATIIKHATPCGAAIGKNISDAFNKAYEADPLSAFGGVIALNRTCDKSTAEKIISFFNEIVMAPAYDDDALEVLKTKKNLRVLEIPNFAEGQTRDFVLKHVRGGTLAQDADIELPDFGKLEVATKKKPTDSEWHDLEMAWKIVKIVKSNAIAVVKDGILLGKGGGQTSRVEAMEIALNHAGEKAKGAAIASDAFFPFPDAIEFAGKYGISSIIQPGGSRGDAEVFAKSDELGISTVLTGMRSFLH